MLKRFVPTFLTQVEIQIFYSWTTIHLMGLERFQTRYLINIPMYTLFTVLVNWAYDHKFSTLITMDCDFTHQPESIPDFINNSKNYDIVVGSRFMFKKSLCEWNLFRKAMTFLGHFLTKNCLKMTYDATGAYRLYRLDKIPRRVFHIINSATYSFFSKSLYILRRQSYLTISMFSPFKTYHISSGTLPV